MPSLTARDTRSHLGGRSIVDKRSETHQASLAGRVVHPEAERVRPVSGASGIRYDSPKSSLRARDPLGEIAVALISPEQPLRTDNFLQTNAAVVTTRKAQFVSPAQPATAQQVST